MMRFELKNLVFFILLNMSLIVSFSQSQENIEYMEQKEIELTNDSSYWDNHSVFYLGFNRLKLYNWAAGGMNYSELHGLANLRFDYRHNKFHWNNFINVQFGVIKSSYGNDGLWLKNDDVIELRSKFSRRTNHLWDYTFLIDVRTQFTYGYYTEIDRVNNNYMDNFLSPIYPIFGLGLDYHASNHLTVDVSPFTAKSTIVKDDSLSKIGVFGLQPGENLRTEAGLYLNLLYTHDSIFNIKNLHFMSDITLFGNYLESPGNIDFVAEFITSYHFNNFFKNKESGFSLTFQGWLIYDHDIKIPQYNKNGIDPVYLTRPEGQLDPVTGDNHYFFDYNDPNALKYNIGYVENGIEDGFLDPDQGDYQGYKVIKTGAALQFMEYWMLGLSFTF
jgi:hypothetical protein